MNASASSGGTGWNRGLRLLPWLALLALTALNLLYISRLGPNDDAYITYRVARNLAQGLGPVYNSGEQVSSITTPGYALLLAALSPVSHDFVLLALLLNGLALLAVGALLIDLSRNWLGALVAVSLALTFPLLSEALGMETPLYVAGILAAFSAYQRATARDADARSQNRWLMATAAASAAAFLLRPDGLLVALAIGLHWLATRRRVSWRAVGVFAALTLPWLIFAWLYYGSPVPNTLAAKATQALGEAIPRWGAGLATVAVDWARQFSLPAALAAAGLILALARRRADRLPMLLWVALYILGHVLLGVRSYFWYYVPIAPVAALLAGDAVAAFAAWLTQPLAGRPRAGLVRAVTLAGLVALALLPALSAATALAKAPELRRREEAYLLTAEALRSHCTDEAGAPVVGMAEIGLMGYISNCRIVDFAGLLQPDVAHLALGPAEKMAWTIQRYHPDLVVLTGGVNYPFQVADAPWFRARYETLNIDDQDGFRSVVHRKALGPANQRDVVAAAWRSDDSAAQVQEALYFEPGASAAISLHAFLPAGSALEIAVDDGVLQRIEGTEPQWRDVAVQPLPQASDLRLSLALTSDDQPAAVAWIASNAVPAVYYFAPSDDASQRPRPTVPFDSGDSVTVRLASAASGPVALELLHRDRPGVALAIAVNGQDVAIVGGVDGWRTERIALPENLLDGQQPITVEIRHQGSQRARLGSLALVAAGIP